MRILLVLAIFYSIFSFGSANIKQPAKQGNGYENVNRRQEYRYYAHPDQEIWHEFGRPFWKSESKTTKIEKVAPKPAPVTKVVASRDSDFDGVWDRVDQCPETKRGEKVNSLGCAAKTKRNLSLNVKFELGEADIVTTYTSAIDKLGMALKENKDLKIQIQGHTDTTGKTSFNNSLSQKRSLAVKEYLMRKYNIPGSRLDSRGFGSKDPVASNDTLKGRKTNRRVDIKIIE
jgi:OOP family OmpA-OmpF porin